jgi:hypothetical protein
MILILILLTSLSHAAPVREVSLKPKEVGTVNTAISYSTVIQLSQKPLNVVLGDQSAFRVEFINDSITIKPARSGAKTNLFIFTENDRFNLTLKAGSPASVDYVVRLRRIFSDPKKTVALNRFHTQAGLRLTLLKATFNDRETFLDFSIHNLGKKNVTLHPEHFRIAIDDLVKPIRSLYIDAATIKPGGTITGSILFPAANLGKKLSLWIGVSGGKPAAMVFFIQKGGSNAF